MRPQPKSCGLFGLMLGAGAILVRRFRRYWVTVNVSTLLFPPLVKPAYIHKKMNAPNHVAPALTFLNNSPVAQALSSCYIAT
jgi:hypothetical protein